MNVTVMYVSVWKPRHPYVDIFHQTQNSQNLITVKSRVLSFVTNQKINFLSKGHRT